ncbi:probable splicing factor, arginine/serine-rich 6 [Toxorhynchites rutilus septentrionalis]|uniref:probable splicing factor, arginine/serine-rich 6 n=1 Tax=Toxorhynchites rutilus septentrionalis TaxID=329112 RepID=UPI002479E964|nr:probable splicing factor, arginine/serine-rich 6 [Toxorhynchites rutilus septentrionalis]XP_055624514.1 probable splicing factor, arginine/serine-rich 6 [Toxorhynchites rutilus septentrionalis]XP_055624515.1 probable splicing factor, arginine/serine-rich 6 [Toxorhynchites rutilus septentrionalis]
MSNRMSRHPHDAKIYVGELGEDGNKQEIEDAFAVYGSLRSVWVARNPPGFAFVEFEDARDAEEAVRCLDGRKICGRRARVELSTRKGGSGGFRGGERGRGGGRGGFRSDGRDRVRRRSRSRSPRSRSREYRPRSGSNSRDERGGRYGDRDRRRRSRSRSPKRTTRSITREYSNSPRRSRS